MTTVPAIPEYTGQVPIKDEQDQITFSNNVGNYLDYFDITFTPQSASMVTAMNSLSIEMDDLSTTMVGYSNYKGDYATTTVYAQGESVTFGGTSYVSKEDNNIDFQPDLYPAKWNKIEGGLSEVKGDLTPELGGSLNALGYTIYNATIGTVTGLSLNVGLGNILKATLTTDSSIHFSGFNAGSTDWLVEVGAAGFTITWDASVTWDGDGTEPEWTAGVDTAYFYTTDGGTSVKGMRVRAGA